MALREIMVLPHPCLRKVALEVPAVDDEIRALVDDMFDTMDAADGVGLAAPQINVNLRVFVMNAAEDPMQRIAAINPEIIERSEALVTRSEGCLSIPGVYEDVTRPERVVYRALDRDGQPFEAAVEGLEAACVQHEIDHLNGKLFLDYLSALKRSRVRKKFEKKRREG